MFTMTAIDFAIILIYMGAMLAIGFIAKGKINDMDDFILGGKRFGKFALVGTIMATMVGSGMMMGTAGNTYSSGATGTALWMYAGFSIGLIVMGFLSKAERKTNARSLAEIVSKSFGTKARLAAAVVVVFYAVALVAINVAGLRTILMNIFGENFAISMPMATVIAAVLAIAYTALGGFYAVVWTDVAQIVLMIGGVMILGPIFALTAVDGGWSTVTATYEAMGSSATNPFLNGVSSGAVGFFLSYFLASPGDPTMPQRALSAKDDGTAKFSFVASGFIGLYFGIALLILGTCTYILIPDLADPEAALPQLVIQYMPPVMTGLVLAGLIAAVMSSFDSFLILATTHVMYDIGRVIKPDLDNKTITKALPILTVIIGILGVIIALFITSLFDYLYMVFSIIGPATVPVTIAALYFRTKTSKTAALLSIILGALVPAVLYLTVGYDIFLGDPVFAGIIASVVVLVGGSLILKDKPTEEEIQARIADTH